MQVISPRASILNKDGIFSLVILSSDKKWKVYLLFTWLLLWTISGVFYITMYVNSSNEASFYRYQYDLAVKQSNMKVANQIYSDIEKNQNKRIFIIGLLAFWAYFEFKVGRTFLFRRFGKEKLWIKNGKLYYQREINGKGKTKEYDPSLINDFEILKENRGDFFVQMQESFWIIGGEKMAFNYASKSVKFGIQLTESETETIYKAVKKELKKY